jgi:sucrose phosphorylase
MEAQTVLNPKISDRLQRLYGERAEEAEQLLSDVIRSHSSTLPNEPRSTGPGWNEHDMVLITYGDQIHDSDQHPLCVLRQWLSDEELNEQLSVIHILPFSPYSSDDGFSVIDYRQVDPQLGSWNDIAALAKQSDLMFDLVLNHVSRRSKWFADYQAGTTPWDGYFIECDQQEDLSQVTRPRSLPLLTAVETSRGTRHLWTTFSDDQIDLNFAEPAVLAEMLDIFLDYVERGARIIRLDAIAYLWKTIGTTCIHLPQTHEVVKLFRGVLDLLAPHVILLTETNVPHRENVSYFGDGDEAHMVYQFSLPPLVLDAFIHEDASPLKKWLAQLAAPRTGTTYFNFTSSHDGIGLRPLEGWVSDERLQSLVATVQDRGGLVNTMRQADGTDAPYELNITFVDALLDPQSPYDDRHRQRFLASQSIMLSLQGIPGIYFHCLVGSPNDQQGVAESGHNRRINRHKYDLDGLRSATAVGTFQRNVLTEYQRLLTIRGEQSAFHPDARQQVLVIKNPAIIGWKRTSQDQEVIVLANVSSLVQIVEFDEFDPDRDGDDNVSERVDLLESHPASASPSSIPLAVATIKLAPYQVRWLSRVVQAGS